MSLSIRFKSVGHILKESNWHWQATCLFFSELMLKCGLYNCRMITSVRLFGVIFEVIVKIKGEEKKKELYGPILNVSQLSVCSTCWFYFLFASVILMYHFSTIAVYLCHACQWYFHWHLLEFDAAAAVLHAWFPFFCFSIHCIALNFLSHFCVLTELEEICQT